MIPRYHSPRGLDEACALLAAGDEAMIYAGGTAVQILIKQGESVVLELTAVEVTMGFSAPELGVRTVTVSVMSGRQPLELQPGQPRVEPALRVETVVIAFLDDPALVHDDDAVGGADGGEAVGDDDRRPVRHQPLELGQLTLHGLQIP